MDLEIIILAGGQGKRMHSATPKVLHPLAGTPMLERVVNNAQELNPKNIHIIYNKNVPIVKEKMQHLTNVNWVIQPEALGTAHAVTQVLPHLNENSQVIMLTGDAPLVSTEILAELTQSSPPNSLGIISTLLENPHGYGRIIRHNMNNNVIAIVEQKDTTEQQAKINEVYAGIMTASSHQLKKWLPQIDNDNAQQEYYLTDMVAIAIHDGIQISGIVSEDEMALRGVNNLRELIVLEKYFYLQKAYELMARGVTIRDPDRFILRGELIVGTDIVIDTNVIIEGKVCIGNNSRIGSNVIIRNSRIGDRVLIDDNCVIDNQDIDDDTTINYIQPTYEYIHPSEENIPTSA